jgi:hypothetical protein
MICGDQISTASPCEGWLAKATERLCLPRTEMPMAKAQCLALRLLRTGQTEATYFNILISKIFQFFGRMKY